jgi:hypothetical protein
VRSPRRILIAALALVAALALPATAPAASKRNKCRTSSTTAGAKAIVKSKAVVVFTKRGDVYGCSYSGGPVARLLDEGGGIELGGGNTIRPILADRYVAYVTYGSAIGDEYDRVVTWDLRKGRVLYEAASTAVTALRLKTNGSFAWEQESVVQSTDFDHPLYEVHEVSQVDQQNDVLLDRGKDVDPAALRIGADGASVTWLRGGVTRSAPLR